MSRAFSLSGFSRTGFDVDPWNDAIKQAEVWTVRTHPIRVFDPAVFDNNPIFDTGTPEGVWRPKAKQVEVWTAKVPA